LHAINTNNHNNSKKTNMEQQIIKLEESQLSSTCINEENNSRSHYHDHAVEENLNINIYRYKFTDHFTEELYSFSKIHQYDHRKDFKEAWTLWTEEHNDLITEETQRLTQLGYDGDVLDKMFKSARYYFRKKSTEKKAPKERREYVAMNRDLLEKMDQHIQDSVHRENFKPSNSFDEFCNENINLLKEEVNVLCNSGLTDPREIQLKMKKTYKNRYFLIINKLPNKDLVRPNV